MLPYFGAAVAPVAVAVVAAEAAPRTKPVVQARSAIEARIFLPSSQSMLGLFTAGGLAGWLAALSRDVRSTDGRTEVRPDFRLGGKAAALLLGFPSVRRRERGRIWHLVSGDRRVMGRVCVRVSVTEYDHSGLWGTIVLGTVNRKYSYGIL